MASAQISPFRRAWIRWKALKLPWRRRFLVGLDLSGNTYWEFRNKLSPQSLRMRRVVEYPSHVHYSDISIPPQWHQWLRHTREEAPSITEQSQDLVRQRNLKILAAEADKRWAAKPSFLDRPGERRGLPLHALQTEGDAARIHDSEEKSPTDRENQNAGNNIRGDSPRVGGEGQQQLQGRTKRGASPTRVTNDDNPWKKARGPSEDWQPQSWTPNTRTKRD